MRFPFLVLVLACTGGSAPLPPLQDLPMEISTAHPEVGEKQPDMVDPLALVPMAGQEPVKPLDLEPKAGPEPIPAEGEPVPLSVPAGVHSGVDPPG